jgi:hypothetical protein
MLDSIGHPSELLRQLTTETRLAEQCAEISENMSKVVESRASMKLYGDYTHIETNTCRNHETGWLPKLYEHYVYLAASWLSEVFVERSECPRVTRLWSFYTRSAVHVRIRNARFHALAHSRRGVRCAEQRRLFACACAQFCRFQTYTCMVLSI